MMIFVYHSELLEIIVDMIFNLFESNWVKTLPGKGFFLYFRAYGPKKEFFDRKWILSDLKKR